MSEQRGVNTVDMNAPAEAEDSGLWEIIKVIVQALLIALVIRTALFQPFNIPSGSLIPTLLVGDYIFVSKYSYGFSHFSVPGFLDYLPKSMSGRLFGTQPKRGDIIVFKLPRDGETDYVKRLIGLPGDKIQMITGRLYVNGNMVQREALPPYLADNRFGSPAAMPHYAETLPGGVKHEIIQIAGDNGTLANTKVFEVPADHYFFMGDNRDNSTDSRVPQDADPPGVGFVPFENLIGRAEIIFFSVGDGSAAWQFWRWPWTVRWERLFSRVH